MTLLEFLKDDRNARGLLQAIRENLDDDLSRCIFADVCEESGFESFAEFMRLMLEYEIIERELSDKRALRYASSDPKYLRYEQLVQRLNILYADVYCWAWPDVAYSVRRGFINRIICTAEDWISYGDAIVAHPFALNLSVSITSCPRCQIVASSGSYYEVEIYGDDRIVKLSGPPPVRAVARKVFTHRWPQITSWRIARFGY